MDRTTGQWILSVKKSWMIREIKWKSTNIPAVPKKKEINVHTNLHFYLFTYYYFFSASTDYFSQVQNNELRPHMRKEVAHWMLEVCEAEHCQPEIFCLAINYLDRFLSLCKIAQSQLQLLASVCLLVACKVRGHVTLPASKLVEYSDFNLDVLNIMVSIIFIYSFFACCKDCFKVKGT